MSHNKKSDRDYNINDHKDPHLDFNDSNRLSLNLKRTLPPQYSPKDSKYLNSIENTKPNELHILELDRVNPIQTSNMLHYKHTSNNSDNKSLNTDSYLCVNTKTSSNASSKVLHFRNVSLQVSKSSLVSMVESFGPMKHLVLIRHKNQALVEMCDMQSAVDIISFFNKGFAEVDGRRVYIEFSMHTELSKYSHKSKRKSKVLFISFNSSNQASLMHQIKPIMVFQVFNSYGKVSKAVVLPCNELKNRQVSNTTYEYTENHMKSNLTDVESDAPKQPLSKNNYHNKFIVHALVEFESIEIAEEVQSILNEQPVTFDDKFKYILHIQYSHLDTIASLSPYNSIVNINGVPTIPTSEIMNKINESKNEVN